MSSTEVAAGLPTWTGEAQASAHAPVLAAAQLDARLGRAFDVASAAALLLFVAPLMLAVAVLIWIRGDGSIVFRHARLGQGGRLFDCYKFRSMRSDAKERIEHLLATDAQARAEWEADHKLRNDPRITTFGSFLRKSSLDELPQLFNVLRGDMSLVGPRPIVPAEQARYGRRMADYFRVRPGITGLWQVSGRNGVSYRRRVALDVTYARRKSLALDLKILAATVPAVLFSKGAH